MDESVKPPHGTWIVGNVDRAARDAAQDRAAAAGMSVGAWIDRAIRTHGRGGPMNVEAFRTAVEGEFRASSARIDAGLRPVGLALHDLALRLAARRPLPASAPGRNAAGARRRLRPAPPSPPTQSLMPVIASRELPSPQPRRAGDDGDGSADGNAAGRRESSVDAEQGSAPALQNAVIAGGPASNRGRLRRWARQAAVVLVVAVVAAYGFAGPIGLGQTRSAFNDAVTIRATTFWQTLDDAGGAAGRAVSHWFGPATETDR